MDWKDSIGNIRPGDRCEIVHDEAGALEPFQPQRGRYSYNANEIRDAFKKYFLSQKGQVPWQWEHVRNAGPRRQQ